MNNEDHARILNLLADILREEGKPSESRDVFSETLRTQGYFLEKHGSIHHRPGRSGSQRTFVGNSFAEWNGAAEMAREHQAPAIEAVALRGLVKHGLTRAIIARAEPLLRRAIAIFRSILGFQRRGAHHLGFIGQLYLAEDKTALAQDTLTQALDLAEARCWAKIILRSPSCCKLSAMPPPGAAKWIWRAITSTGRCALWREGLARTP